MYLRDEEEKNMHYLSIQLRLGFLSCIMATYNGGAWVETRLIRFISIRSFFSSSSLSIPLKRLFDCLTNFIIRLVTVQSMSPSILSRPLVPCCQMPGRSP